MNIESTLPILGELLIKSFAILLLAAAIVRLWRGATAAQRHLVWFAAMVTLLLLPMTRLVTPRWSVPLERPAKKVHMTMTALPVAPQVAASEPVPFVAPAPRASRWTPPGWRKALPGFWLAGVAFLLGYRLLGSWRLRQLERGSHGLEDERVQEMAARVREEFQIARRVRVRVSDECRVPMTWGTRRPVLLLPAEALQWTDARVITALRHEAGHIRRQDYLARWISQVACAVYWPNPLAWVAGRELRVAQEQATDDLVLRAGTPPDEYAAQLLDAARTVALRGFFARHAVAMASPSTLAGRVVAIVDSERDRRPLSRRAMALGTLIGMGIFALCSAAQLQGDDRVPQAEEKVAGAPAAKASAQQIMIASRFVELPPGVTTVAGTLVAPQEVFSDPQFQLIIRSLNQTQGVELLSSLNATTRSQLRAAIEVVREFPYVNGWEKDAGGWKPKTTEKKNVGATLEVMPEIKADGTIELRLKPSVVEFNGFIDLDGDKDAVVTQNFAGKRLKAIFAERTLEKAVTLRSGETVALSGFQEEIDGKPAGKNANRRHLILFVSARIINSAAPGADAGAAGPGEDNATPRGTITDEAGRPGGGPAANGEKELGDLFFKAFQTAEKGTKLEAEHQYRRALEMMDEALQTINQIPVKDPKWQAEVVAYRSERIREAIQRLTPLVASASASASSPPAPDAAPAPDSAPAKGGTVDLQGGTLTVNGGATPGLAGESPVRQKTLRIVLPKVEFREATLAEAVELVRKLAVERDPEGTGVKIEVLLGNGPKSATAINPEDARISLSLTNIPLFEALQYVAGLANLRAVYTKDAVVLQPIDPATQNNAGNAPPPPIPGLNAPAPAPENTKPLFTKEWKVSPDLVPKGQTARDWLTANGVVFHEGASAVLVPVTGRLIVRNTQEELDLIDTLLSQDPAQKATATAALPNVSLTANSTRMENGIAIAEGNAIVVWGEYHISATKLRYDPNNRQLDLMGKVAIRNAVNLIEGENVTVVLEPNGQIAIRGPHKVTVLGAPATAAATAPAAAPVPTEPVAITPVPRKAFANGDRIEIRDVSGSVSTLKVGGTYRVRGFCLQGTIQNASLYLGVTATGPEKAIQPVPGTTLFKAAPKGMTQFEFNFTPLRPGKLHVTLYDLDNADQRDNSEGGIELGEVAP